MAELDEHSEEIREAQMVLPAWFVPRMMGDNWSFGLLLTTGHLMAIATIYNVRKGDDGIVWLDVDMLTSSPVTPQ